LGNALAADPPADGWGRELQFELTDGTVITGRTDVKTITIRTASGNILKVPVANLTELTVGLKKQRGSVEHASLQCKIRAGESIFVGMVVVRQFRIISPYGRVAVKLNDIRRILPGVRATSGNVGRWIVELRDKTRLKGILISRSLRVQTRYGIMAVPFAQIHEATFATDGKTVRVRCWNSDWFVGTITSGTTITLKTNKGRSNLSAGKIAVVSYGPVTFKEHLDSIDSIVFSPDGRRLASVNEDQTIRLWDTVTGKEACRLKGHSRPILSIAFSPDGKRLGSGGGGYMEGRYVIRLIKLWDTATG